MEMQVPVATRWLPIGRFPNEFLLRKMVRGKAGNKGGSAKKGSAKKGKKAEVNILPPLFFALAVREAAAGAVVR